MASEHLLAPSGAPLSESTGEVARVARSDIKFGSVVLDITQHVTPFAVGLAFVTVVALQDMHPLVGLIAATVVLISEPIVSFTFWTKGRLKVFPYGLAQCFFWPVFVWLVVWRWDPDTYAQWLPVAFFGGVALLMALTILITFPWARDFMRDKTPEYMWHEVWFKRMATNISFMWTILFLIMALVALIPTLRNERGTKALSNIICCYLVPLWLACGGVAATRFTQERYREWFVLGTQAPPPGLAAVTDTPAILSAYTAEEGQAGAYVAPADRP